MTDHLRRIREHMELETQALLLEGERARLFDHNGNRGSEAEHSILRWLRARFAPGYTVSSGEIIDSFDTSVDLETVDPSVDLKSRQQDGILHRNDPEANRFLLPSGMRLVPIETVAAVVEVKLTLSKSEFDKSDAAATQTARLRLRANQIGSSIPGPSPTGSSMLMNVLTDEKKNGIPADDPQLAFSRPTFAIFAFGGIKEIETIASWLPTAKSIDLVCCLEAGCVLRVRRAPADPGLCHVSQQEHALGRFGECLRAAIGRHERLWKAFNADFSKYATSETLPYWDETGSYEHPPGYKPPDEEVAGRQRLYQVRPSVRPKT